MQKISPFLWFDGQAEAAMMSVEAELHGQRFNALNGGPQYKFTPAISFFVDCNTQAEVDELWENLCAGGRPNMCGWLTDRFGVSWQIVPSRLGELIRHPAAMQAMLKMQKLDIAALERAAS